MKVTGKFNKENGFVYLYTENALYTIASKDNWGCVEIGQKTESNIVLDKETFENWKAECTQEGTFELL